MVSYMLPPCPGSCRRSRLCCIARCGGRRQGYKVGAAVSLGAGVVRFEREEDAQVALGKIQAEGLELMGSVLQVQLYTEPTVGVGAPQPAMRRACREALARTRSAAVGG